MTNSEARLTEEQLEALIRSVRSAESLAITIKSRLHAGLGTIDRDLLQKASEDDSEKHRVNVMLSKQDLDGLANLMRQHGISNRSAMIRYLIRRQT